MKNAMRKYLPAVLAAIFLIASAAVPVHASSTKSQATSAAPASVSKQNWDSLVAAAKKEGSVSIFATWSPQTRVALTQAFKARYGIDVVFLFENVVDVKGRKYNIPVAVAIHAASREIYGLAMQCGPREISETWTRALLNPIEPRVVATGPVQEEVRRRSALRAQRAS